MIEKIMAIWSHLLPNKTFDLNANFFDCGGNSILLAYLQWHLEKSFFITLSAIEFFSYPTIAGMAELVALKRST